MLLTELPAYLYWREEVPRKGDGALFHYTSLESDIICRAIKQHTHSFLGTPNCLILTVDFNTLFLPFNLKN